jgi:hypothetical protein
MAAFSSEVLSGGRNNGSQKFLESPEKKRDEDLKIRKVLK